MTLMDVLVWAQGIGVVLAVSWVADYFGWFINVAPKMKKLIFFGISAGVAIASMLVVNFVPANIIEIVTPYFNAIIAIFIYVFISDGFHAVTKLD